LFVYLQQWLTRRGHHDLSKVTEELLQTFLQEYLSGRNSRLGAPLALRRLLGVLRDAGVVPPAKSLPRKPAQHLTDDYRRFLRDECGCSESTIAKYLQHIDRFLAGRFGI